MYRERCAPSLLFFHLSKKKTRRCCSLLTPYVGYVDEMWKVWDQVTLDFLTAHISTLFSFKSGGRKTPSMPWRRNSRLASDVYLLKIIKDFWKMWVMPDRWASVTRARIDGRPSHNNRQQKREKRKYNKDNDKSNTIRHRTQSRGSCVTRKVVGLTRHEFQSSRWQLFRLPAVCLLLCILSFSLWCCVVASLLMRYTDGDLRAPQVICFVYNDWTE